VLLGLFFITIGMMLDWHILTAGRWCWRCWCRCCSRRSSFWCWRGWWAPPPGGAAHGLYLAQAGEFGFVLLSLTQDHGLVQLALMNPILAAMVLSMLATPFLIMYSNRIVMKLVASDWLQQSLQMTTIARKTINTSKHVIICGYGRCGQNLARMLEREGIPYMALDLDPTGCARPQLPAIRWCMATPPACKP
jgi:CPA2 family monovalent cation:H+ antiporter-2